MKNPISKFKNLSGSIKISESVVETVTRNATLEVDGVEDVSSENIGIKGLITRTNYTKPIRIDITEGVAKIQVSIIVDSTKRVPDLANAVQIGIKNAVQSMTGLTVSSVDVIIAGVTQHASAK